MALQSLQSSVRPIPRKTSLMEPGEFDQPGLGPGSASSQIDPIVQRFLLGSRQKDETFDRLVASTRAGDDPNDVAGLTKLFGGQSEDLANSPLTAQQEELDTFDTAQQAAQLEGFPTSQDAALRGRQVEDRKIGLPLEQVAAQGAQARETLGTSGRNAINLANVTSRNALGSQRESQNFLKSLQGLGGDSPITRIAPPTATSGGSMSFAQPQRTSNLNALLQQVTATIRNLTQSGVENPFDPNLPNTPELQTFRTSVGQLISQSGASAEAQQTVQNFFNDPNSMNLDVSIDDLDPNDPDYALSVEVSNLIRSIRGL